MKRIIVALSVALATSAVLVAQQVKSESSVKSDDAKAVTYTGCLATGAASTSYVLENAVPVKQETKTETQVNAAGVPESATKTTTTTYALVPGGSVEFQSNVGHKVEVTAMLIPAGDDTTKIESKSKTEVEGQPSKEVESKEKVAQTDHPQLRVVSIKHLADRCTPQP